MIHCKASIRVSTGWLGERCGRSPIKLRPLSEDAASSGDPRLPAHLPPAPLHRHTRSTGALRGSYSHTPSGNAVKIIASMC